MEYKTNIISGMPHDCLTKRMYRIHEARMITGGTIENPTKHVIYDLPDGGQAYFLKPGKEAKRKPGKENVNDMLPCVDGMNKKYSFADVWNLLCILRNNIDINLYKSFSAILYDLAYLRLCDVHGRKVRISEFLPEIISPIQQAADKKNLNINVLSLVYFIDLLGWNEDVKYHREGDINLSDKNDFDGQPSAESEKFIKGLKEPKGRINTILTCISVPLSFYKFTENVIANANDRQGIDFSIGLEVAQTLANRRGIYTLTQEKLEEFLSPYLTKKSKPERGLQLKIDY